MARKAALLIFLLLSYACQFKAKEDTGALIAGHQEVANRFSVAVPAARTYTETDNLDLVLTFPYAVTVTNTPRIELTVGAAVVYADYLSGSGTRTLTFRYDIQPGDTDSDGVEVINTIDLNGGLLEFTGTNGTENCNIALTVPSTTGVKVDTTDASVALVTPPSNATYLLGMPLTFYATMSENVVVTGTPRLTLTVGATTRYANYVSGSGGSLLVFRYTVAASDLDANGIVVAPAIDLNSGTATITDTAGNAATLTFAAPNTTGVLVDGNTPYVTAITPPANGNYAVGAPLDFVFTFSEAVTVAGGTPTLGLTIGSTSRVATYQSGSPSTQLTFRYIVQSGDLDTDGIASASTFTLGGATIRDGASTNILNLFSMPTLTGVIIADSSPRILSFTIANNTYYIGNTINIVATYDQAVTITGTPRIPIALATGGPVYATYVSGSGGTAITYSYTVTSGTDDPDGITLVSPMELSGGTIVNGSAVSAALGFTVPSTPLVIVSGIRPTITSITPPSDATYLTGNTMSFTVNFSENVVVGNPTDVKLNITIGSTSRAVDYVSGSGTNALVFNYTVVGADADTNGIVVNSLTVTPTGYITDGTATNNLATLTFTAPNTTGVLVNATVPTISTVTPPANATYRLNQNLDFSVVFSENVIITGAPAINLTVGSTARTAVWVSGAGTTHTFRYTVPLDDVDSNGIATTSPMDLLGGTIQSTLGVNANLAFTSPNTASVNVDGDIPNIISTNVPPGSVYDVNDVSLTFTATFDQTVTVTGSPRWVLNIGGTTRYAVCSPGSNITVMTCTHTLVANDIDLDGISLGNGSNLDLNGGTIRDANLNDSSLALGSPTLSNVIVTYTNMIGWWDMDLASSVTTAVCGLGSCAATVADKSGRGYNLTQTGTAQPEYFPSGFGAGNRGYLGFDGANDFMNLSLIMPTIRTMIIVFQTEPATMTAQDLFFSSAGGANARVQITAAGGLTYGGTAQAGWSRNGTALTANATTGAPALAASTRYILVVRFSANQTVATVQRVGNTNFNGKIAEIMTFNNGSALTDAQLLPIINYLNTKHQIY